MRSRSDLPPGVYPRGSGYLVRIRRNGTAQTTTLPSLDDALAWRSRAIAAAEGRGERPEAPRLAAAVLEAPGRAVTVEQAARRLARGMLDGTLRSRDGSAYKPGVVRKYEAALRLDVTPA